MVDEGQKNCLENPQLLLRSCLKKKNLCQMINPSQLPYIPRDTPYLSFRPKTDMGCAVVSESALDVKC